MGVARANLRMLTFRLSINRDQLKVRLRPCGCGFFERKGPALQAIEGLKDGDRIN
jgi:hypothetical protein